MKGFKSMRLLSGTVANSSQLSILYCIVLLDDEGYNKCGNKKFGVRWSECYSNLGIVSTRIDNWGFMTIKAKWWYWTYIECSPWKPRMNAKVELLAWEWKFKSESWHCIMESCIAFGLTATSVFHEIEKSSLANPSPRIDSARTAFCTNLLIVIGDVELIVLWTKANRLRVTTCSGFRCIHLAPD